MIFTSSTQRLVIQHIQFSTMLIIDVNNSFIMSKIKASIVTLEQGCNESGTDWVIHAEVSPKLNNAETDRCRAETSSAPIVQRKLIYCGMEFDTVSIFSQYCVHHGSRCLGSKHILICLEAVRAHHKAAIT